MQNFWQVLTLLLSVALVALSIKIAINNNTREEQPIQNTSEVVIDNILTRSSVRTYTSQAIDDEVIQTLLRAGMAAPSGGNKQPWELMVITDRAILDAIPPIIKGAHMANKAPMAIAVLGSPASALIPDYWVQDCSAVTQNILLAAHGLGLGAVWCGAFPENGTGRVEATSKLLNLPQGTYALSIIVIGHPDSEPNIHDKWDPSKVHYNTY